MSNDLFFNRDKMYDNIPNAEGKIVEDLVQLKTNIDIKANPFYFGAKGNANVMSAGIMYTDATKSVKSKDDTQAIRDFLAYMKANHPYQRIVFPSANYLITDTIVIPEECRSINFNDSTFFYFGADNTYCISGGGVQVTAPSEDYTGGFIHADWSNLTISGNYNQSNKCNGMNTIRLRNAKFSNIRIQYMNVCILAGDTWSSSYNNCKLYWSNLGVRTGRACNGVNFSKMDVMSCLVGMEIGKGSNVGSGNWGINGLTVDSQSLFQSCDTAIELHFIKQANVINSYFEDNNRVLDIPQLTANETIMNFTFDSNMVDTSQNKECFLRLADNVRPVSMNITKNTFTGYKHLNTMFHRPAGINGTLGHWTVTDNSMLGTIAFTDVFPDTWKIGSVKTDIPFLPTIDTANWTVAQQVRVLPLGQNRFEISGAVKRVSGKTSTLLFNFPYYFSSDSKKSYVIVNQYADGSTTVKPVSLEANTWPKALNIYTVDTTDTNTINLTGGVWCTR